jgi:hypothetical protein
MKQLDPLWPKCVRHKAQARNVSTWTSETGDESRFDGVGHTHDDDWDGLGGFLSRLRSWRINRDDHFHLEPQKLFYKRRESLILSCRISQLYADSASLDITKFVKLGAKRLKQTRLKVLRKYANPMGSLLLCTQWIGHGNN